MVCWICDCHLEYLSSSCCSLELCQDFYLCFFVVFFYFHVLCLLHVGIPEKRYSEPDGPVPWISNPIVILDLVGCRFHRSLSSQCFYSKQGICNTNYSSNLTKCFDIRCQFTSLVLRRKRGEWSSVGMEWDDCQCSLFRSSTGAGIVGDSLSSKFQFLYIAETGTNSIFKLSLQSLLRTSQLSGFNGPQQISPNPQNSAQFYRSIPQMFI